MQGPMSIAIAPKGGYAIVTRDNGGNWTNVKCGWPKLSLSTDGQQWNTCSPTGKDMDNHSENATAAYAGKPVVRGVADLPTALAKFNTLFVDIRYIFEKRHYEGSGITDLIRLMRFIREWVDEMPKVYRHERS